MNKSLIISEKNALKLRDMDRVLVNSTSNETDFHFITWAQEQKSRKINRFESNQVGCSSGSSSGFNDAVDFQLDADKEACAIYDDTTVEIELINSRCSDDKHSVRQVEIAVLDLAPNIENGKGDVCGLAAGCQEIGAFLDREDGHSIRRRAAHSNF